MKYLQVEWRHIAVPLPVEFIALCCLLKYLSENIYILLYKKLHLWFYVGFGTLPSRFVSKSTTKLVNNQYSKFLPSLSLHRYSKDSLVDLSFVSVKNTFSSANWIANKITENNLHSDLIFSGLPCFCKRMYLKEKEARISGDNEIERSEDLWSERSWLSWKKNDLLTGI